MTTVDDTDSNDDLSWVEVPEETARQILHQGEEFLRAQLQIAIAADQRAVTVASIFVAAATAVVGGTFAYWTQTIDNALLWSGMVVGITMLVGASFGFWAARPVTFFAPGNHPNSWWRCRVKPLSVAIGGETENYQLRIERNEETLSANGRALNRCIVAALLSPAIGIATWLAIVFL